MKQGKYFLALAMAFMAYAPSAHSQKWVKKARKAQVTVIARTQDGQLRETQGVFIDQEGTVVTDYDTMRDAIGASILDADGKEYPVECVAGASALYNVSKLKAATDGKKTNFLELSGATHGDGTEVYVMPSPKSDKKAICQTDTIARSEVFKEKFGYLTLGRQHTPNAAVMDAEGRLVGLVQPPAKEGAATSYCMDAKYTASLAVSALDAGNDDLKSIRIRKALPWKEDDALTYIYLTAQKDTTFYRQYVEEFMERYPSNTSGYVAMAEYLVGKGDLQSAKSTYDKALGNPTLKADEIHYSLSKTIYSLNSSPSYETFGDWDLGKSLAEANAAYDSNPLPIYVNQQAECLYALKRYAEAADKFVSLAGTNLRSPEVFLYAVQCKKDAQAPQEEIIALLDSALSCYPTPYPVAAANTVIVRAKALADAGRYREAVKGFNDFEHLNAGKVTANFHYEREQLEIKCRMYPSALNDIESAIRLAPREPLYHAEAASLNYRVNDIEQAIRHARQATELDDSFGDAHRILGVCLNQAGKRDEALRHLQRAVELGDTMAQGIIDRIKAGE